MTDALKQINDIATDIINKSAWRDHWEDDYLGGSNVRSKIKKITQLSEEKPTMWFVKDYADGWIAFDNEADALREVEATGAMMLVGIKP